MEITGENLNVGHIGTSENPQMLQDQQVYAFLRSAIESDPAAPLEDRLLGLSGVLVAIGQKAQAIKVIDEVVSRQTQDGKELTSIGLTNVGLMYSDAGEAVKAREYIKKAEESSGGESTFELATKCAKHGLGEDARRMLVHVASELSDFNDVEVRRIFDNTIDCLINYGYKQDAQSLLPRFEKALEDYKTPNPNMTWYPSVLTEGYINLARWYKTFDPESETATRFADLAVESIGKLDPKFGTNQPFPTMWMMSNMARAGFEDKIEPFADLLIRPVDKRRAYMEVAQAYSEQEDHSFVEKYYQKALDISKETVDLNSDTWVAEVKVLVFLGRNDEIENLLPNLTHVLSVRREQGDMRLITDVVEVLGEVGLGEKAEEYIKTNFLTEGRLGTYNIEEVAQALGHNISPGFLQELLCYVEPQQRLGIVLGNYKYEDKYGFNRIASQLSGVPTDLSWNTLRGYILQSTEPNRWNEVVAAVRKLTNSADAEQVQNSLRFLLLEYGDAYHINNVFNVLPHLSEKISFDRLDSYRAIVGNQNVEDVLDDPTRRRVIDYLAKSGVVTEAKHLLYIDSTTIDRIDVILKGLGSRGEINKTVLGFLSTVVSQRTSQLSSVVYCIENLGLDISDTSTQKEILGAIDDMGGITPILFDQYRNIPIGERPAFVEKIRNLRDMFYRNVQLNEQMLGIDKESFISQSDFLQTK
jgi:tetratricopeptide (TPR) repeat protein